MTKKVKHLCILIFKKMTAEEIRDISIDSANVYYEYLEQNEKGVQEVDVFEIEYLQSRDVLIKLRLSSKLFDTEAIFFKNLKNGKKYDVSEIKVVEYDNDKNILLIKPTEENTEAFSNLKNADIKVISDLKFLVERVKTWHELNGAKLMLPNQSSKYSEDYSKIEFFKEKELQPSQNQKESLKNIFTNPFSYVWGAPGTGKTQFVLSYAVLHYIRKGDKVAILAPTNNALEQVMRGVIKMTDKAGVERKQILRLGTPSKKFAEEFPEVCEVAGMQKKLNEIDKQISILEKVQAYQDSRKSVEQLKSTIPLFEKLYDFVRVNEKTQKKLNRENTAIKKKEIEIKLTEEEILNLTKILGRKETKKKSLSHKFVKLFLSSQTSIEKAIPEIKKDIFNQKKVCEFYKEELSEIDEKRKLLLSEIKTIQNDQSRYIKVLKGHLSVSEKFKNFSQKLTIDNFKEIKLQIVQAVENVEESLNVDQHIHSEYENKDIETELKNYYETRKKVATFSTEERLKTINVIACTLDGYIGRYVTQKLNVEHIFLDEAGYANIVKALTLFNHSVPISFLGDHKQLPPVCEINDSLIEQDDKYSNVFLWTQSAIFIDTLFVNDKDTCKKNYLTNKPFIPNTITKTSLNSTFRFGNNLAKVLAEHVYEDDFCSSIPNGETKIKFAHGAKKNEELKQRISRNEVLQIKNIVNDLKQASKNDFIILTPYIKQLKELGIHLPNERNDLKILTVHGSQGREWETVILSVVDTSDKWFVDSTRPDSKGLNLLNTAVSRAKKQLIIVCDTNYWMNQDGQLLTDLLRNGENYTAN